LNAGPQANLRTIISRARDDLETARQFLEEGKFRSASIHAYSAVFHGMKALLELEGISVSKHGRVMGEVNRQFVKSGRLERDTSKKLERLFFHRQIGSYSYTEDVSGAEARVDLEDAARLLLEFEAILRQQTQDEFFRAKNSE
jgi:uncharacterized protein (UPF0332 family)